MSKVKFILVFILAALLATATILLPSFSLGFTSLYNEKRIFQGIILIIGAILFFSLLIEHRLNISRKSVTLFVVLGVLISATVFHSNKFQWALFEIGWYLCLVQLSLVLGYIYQKYPVFFERFLLFTVIGFISIYSIRVMGDVVTTFFRADWPIWPNHSSVSVVMGGEELIPQGFLGFQNFRYFNHLQTWTLPILAYAYIHFSKDSEKLLKDFIGGLLAVWFMIAFASGARGSLLAVILSFTVILLLFKKENYKRLVKVSLITLFAGLLLYLLIFHLLIPLGSGKPLARYGSSSRYNLWTVTLMTIFENPLFGVGPMHLANINGPNPLTSPHNTYLMWAAEWGIPAFSVFVYIAYDNLKKWITRAIDKSSDQIIAVTAAFFAGIIHSGASGLMITPLSQLFCVVLVGWMIGIYYNQHNDIIFLKWGFKTKYVVISFILLINLVTFYKFAGDIPYLEKNGDKFQTLYRNKEVSIFPNANATVFPRFWEQGFIGLEDIEEK